MNDEIAGQAILNATIRQLVFILMDTASLHILNRDTLHPLCRQGRLARGGITLSKVSDNAVVTTILCYRDDARVNLKSYSLQ